jgi:hypothetical protein|tara:strand:+ start:2522 stop:4897 length:2376 start_codon:yes stop_codon:yes gene_type:complete
MGIKLPQNALAVGQDQTEDPSLFVEEREVDENLFETGSDDLGVEFPNVREISQMGSEYPGFFKSLIPNVKAMLTSDDLGKAEIFSNAFEDDPKWGGVYQDKFGLPIIIWNETPYYVNKPGFSGTDFNTFLGEVLKYIPATKYASKAKTVTGTIARGVPSYATTEVASKVGEGLMTPDTVASKDPSFADVAGEVGLMTGIGVGADVLAPPLLKAGANVVGAVARATSKGVGTILESTLPKFKPEVVQDSKYPLTVGQRTAEPPKGVTPKQTEQLGEEDILRQSASSEIGTVTVRGFDEMQLGQIRADALKLQDEFGAGVRGADDIYGNIPSEAAEQTQSLVVREADRLKAEAGELYDVVKGAPNAPRMTREGVVNIAEDMLRVVPDFFAPSQIVDGPLAREIANLKRLAKLAKDPKFKSQSLQNIHGYQKRLGTAIKQADVGSPEEAALIQMKQLLDNSLYDGIERGFITGDQEIIDQLRSATNIYADYMGLTGRRQGRDRANQAANRILEQLSSNNYTPVQVTNLLFGHNKFAPNQALPLVLAQLKKSLPESEFNQVKALLKDGILTKAFSGRGGEVTRTAIVNNFNDVFNKQRTIIDELFTKDEILRIKEFRENVLPTLWAEIKLNPSGTSYTMLGSLARQQLLSFPNPLVRASATKILGGIDEAARANTAIDAVRQTINRFQAPLFSDISQSIMRPQFRQEASPTEAGVEPVSESEIQNLQTQMQDFEMPDIATPAFEPNFMPTIPSTLVAQTKPDLDPMQMASATILPDEKDREIAMRQQLGGIGSLG